MHVLLCGGHAAQLIQGAQAVLHHHALKGHQHKEREERVVPVRGKTVSEFATGTIKLKVRAFINTTLAALTKPGM